MVHPHTVSPPPFQWIQLTTRGDQLIAQHLFSPEYPRLTSAGQMRLADCVQMPSALMDTFMIQSGVCCGQTVTDTEVQQQNTLGFRWGKAVPPNHSPKGNTVTAQRSAEVSQ